MFQTKIEQLQALGLVGEFAFDAPSRVQSGVLKSSVEQNNVIGRAFSVVSGANQNGSALTVQAGGNGAFAGLLVMPKSYAGATLAPTLTLANGQAVELALAGEVIIETTTDTKPGDIAFYDVANGALSFAPSGTPTPSGKQLIPNATIHFYTTKASFVAVLKLNN